MAKKNLPVKWSHKYRQKFVVVYRIGASKSKIICTKANAFYTYFVVIIAWNVCRTTCESVKNRFSGTDWVINSVNELIRSNKLDLVIQDDARRKTVKSYVWSGFYAQLWCRLFRDWARSLVSDLLLFHRLVVNEMNYRAKWWKTISVHVHHFSVLAVYKYHECATNILIDINSRFDDGFSHESVNASINPISWIDWHQFIAKPHIWVKIHRARSEYDRWCTNFNVFNILSRLFLSTNRFSQKITKSYHNLKKCQWDSSEVPWKYFFMNEGSSAHYEWID